MVKVGGKWWNVVQNDHTFGALLTLSTNFSWHHAYGYNGNNLKFTFIVTSVTLLPVFLELCRVLYAWTSDFLYFSQKSCVPIDNHKGTGCRVRHRICQQFSCRRADLNIRPLIKIFLWRLNFNVIGFYWYIYILK